jgi:hypothetical protein
MPYIRAHRHIPWTSLDWSIFAVLSGLLGCTLFYFLEVFAQPITDFLANFKIPGIK